MRTNPFLPPTLRQHPSQLVRALALPHEYPPQRLPNFPAVERTALLALNGALPITVGTQTATIGTRVVVFRQAGVPLWCDSTGTYAFGTCWRGAEAGEIDPPASSVIVGVEQMAVSTGGIGTYGAPTGPTYTINNLGSTLPAATPVLGVFSGQRGRPFHYLPVGSSLYLAYVNHHQTGALLPTVTSVRLMVEFWLEKGETATVDITMTPTDTVGLSEVTFSIGLLGISGFTGGFIRILSATVFRSGSSSDVKPYCDLWLWSVPAGTTFTTYSTTGMTVTPPSSTMLLPALLPAGWSTSRVPWELSRVTAMGLLATNVTKVLNKEGTVNAARLPMSATAFTFQLSDLTSVHPFERCYLPLEKGFYTFLPPSVELGTWHDYSLEYNAAHTVRAFAPALILDHAAFPHCISFNDPDGGTGLALNLDWHIEFRSVSNLWQIGLSTLTLEQLHAAIAVLNELGFFYDNIDHQRLIRIGVEAAKRLTTMLPVPLHEATNWLLSKAAQRFAAPKPKPKPAPAAVKQKKAKVARPEKKSKSKLMKGSGSP